MKKNNQVTLFTLHNILVITEVREVALALA